MSSRARLVLTVTLLGLIAPAAAAAVPMRHLIGHSLRGRPIYAYENGALGGKPVLLVGCIDGNEPAGIAIAKALETMAPPPGVDLWIVPDLNPDGVAAGTLQNAGGVDLNRNFPWQWQRLTGTFSSGPRALSEPESRAAHSLIQDLRPRISIWFHQHLGVVDDSQGSVALERRFARLVGLPLARLTDYPGSVASWENHVLAGSTAFVVELHAGSLTAAQALRYARAVLAIS
jgi:protein MpaA